MFRVCQWNLKNKEVNELLLKADSFRKKVCYLLFGMFNILFGTFNAKILFSSFFGKTTFYF
jgi:hypothetical protein